MPRARTQLDEPCVWCGQVGWWSGYGPDAHFAVPKGHTVRLAEIDGMVVATYDTCPQQPQYRPNPEQS
jgi:hypothetical protein